MKKLFNIVIFGSPGSGKGTISKKIIKDFNFNHISTGDLLRTNVLNKTNIGLNAKLLMDKGELVPDQLVLDMVLENYKKNPGNLLLDGYPRTLSQAENLSQNIPINCVIALNIPHQVIIDRLSNRWVHLPSGRTYAADYNPPKVPDRDDITGELLTQRDDDKPETIKNRLIKYEQLTLPLQEYYKKKNILQIFSGTESNVIYPEIKKYLQSVIPK